MPPTAEQTELLACLAHRNEKVARIYSGVIFAFYQQENPGRFQQAAHSMRELLDKCPLLINEEPLQSGDGMKKRLDQVRDAYFNMTWDKRFDDALPLDASAGGLRAVMVELGRYFEWETENRPSARKKTAETLGRLSGPGQPIPVDIANNEVSRWMKAGDYFKKVAHYGQDHIHEAEFMGHMSFVESVLRQRLQPAGVADLDAIDALVEGAEHGQ